MMKTAILPAVAMAALLALFSSQQSFAQSYGNPSDSGSVGGVTNATLAKCAQLNITRAQCSDSSILLKERVPIAHESLTKGSGVGFLTQAGQLVLFIGVLGAIFGGVAAAFFISGKRTKGQITT